MIKLQTSTVVLVIIVCVIPHVKASGRDILKRGPLDTAAARRTFKKLPKDEIRVTSYC